MRIPNGDTTQEVMKLVYQNEDVVFVSIHSLHKVSKYKGKDGEAPRLNKLGTGAWEKLKERTKTKIKDIARDLIRLYSQRREEKGFQFSVDSFLQRELEASFIYEDTPDQSKATADVKADMESNRPMDRLVCGDVGFGKTEVAVRAAFKAVADNKQVAVLVPTTVLAYQHFQTFKDRLKDLPCKVEYLSRARTAAQAKAVIKGLAAGDVNILIGTHRVLSKDVVFKDLGLLIEMSQEEQDEETVQEIEEELLRFEGEFEELRIQTLLTGEYDRDHAIVTLHAGAGGTESCDWANMLYRMYTRWAEKKGFSVEVLDYLEGDVAGIKGVTFEVRGENAYGYLRSEKGVHRLVRISPFNAAGKRQTSFASCDVIPDIEEDIDIEINDDDIRIDTYRSSGAGGQHINKTSSAIRITHFPTGIVVQCQNERSQHMNKDKAMQMLKAKLYLMKQQEQADKVSGIRGEIKEIGFGSQIRSYVMQPYTLVKDHRTNMEISNVNGVLDGNLDPFINAYLSAPKNPEE